MRRLPRYCAVFRSFSTFDRTTSEMGFAQKLRDVPVITGQSRPAEREGSWVCPYPLTQKMDVVVRDLLEKNGWAEVEIKREVDQIFALKTTRCGSSTHSWNTVEEYQRTPWYARFQPNNAATTHFVSYECSKIMEDNLIPPSQRKDPYAHLRKRHYEDSFFHEKFSEGHSKHITREELARMTPGMPQYGTVTRKKYLQFCKEYEKRNKTKGEYIHLNEQYHAWRNSCGGRGNGDE
jgi:hypothetical protein